DDARPRAERPATPVLEELRPRSDEELLAELLAKLVDEIGRGPQPGQRARKRLDDGSLDLLDRRGISVRGRESEREVLERERGDRLEGRVDELFAIDHRCDVL